jgi:hypothetical protein
MIDTKPTHLDFTTVYGAARAINNSELASGLPLSRLLSLSQFVEALVLHERITYELNTSAIWRPYSDLLLNSELLKIIGTEDWFKPLEQIDIDDEISLSVVRGAIDKMAQLSVAPHLTVITLLQP